MAKRLTERTTIWTRLEEAELRSHAAEATMEILAYRFGCGEDAILAKMRDMSLSMPADAQAA